MAQDADGNPVTDLAVSAVVHKVYEKVRPVPSTPTLPPPLLVACKRGAAGCRQLCGRPTFAPCDCPGAVPQIDEAGAEAAAVTAVIVGTSAPGGPIK